MLERLLKRLEDIYVAVTFAEAGEFDEAREIVAQKKKGKRKRIDAPRFIKERLRHVR